MAGQQVGYAGPRKQAMKTSCNHPRRLQTRALSPTVITIVNYASEKEKPELSESATPALNSSIKHFEV